MVSFSPLFLVCKAINHRSRTQAQLMNPCLSQCFPRDREGGSRLLVQSPSCLRTPVQLPALPQQPQPRQPGLSQGELQRSITALKSSHGGDSRASWGGSGCPPNGASQGCDPLHTHHSVARLGAQSLELFFPRLWGYF